MILPPLVFRGPSVGGNASRGIFNGILNVIMLAGISTCASTRKKTSSPWLNVTKLYTFIIYEFL